MILIYLINRKMDEIKTKLLTEMVLKLNEINIYKNIQLILTISWLFELIYTIFVKGNGYNELYWILGIVCFVGYYHIERKIKISYKEYYELKEEFYNNFGDEDI